MKNNMRMKTFLRRYAEIIVAYCVLAVVLVLFAFNQADFFTLYGPQSIFNQVITLCVASLGQTVIILTSGIDLSVGNLIIFSNCVAATIYMPVTNMLGGSILLGGIATVVIVLLIGVLTGGINFAGLFVALDGQSYASIEAAAAAGVGTVNYGLFIQNIIKAGGLLKSLKEREA